MSWTISMETWEIKNVTNGRENILENYRQMIEKKVAPLRTCYETLSPLAGLSLDSSRYADLTSSVASFRGYTFFCDAAGHRVLKCHRESGAISPIQFSNMGVLGLPYWLICPLERVFISENLSRTSNEHIHHFSVLPGKCEIRVNVDIPEGTELAAPLEEACIWRQARGSIAELSWSEDAATSTEKVGVAQQWFDELDNLAFSKPSIESGAQVAESLVDKNFEDVLKVHFSCAANISPGTGEILVSVALYLRLSRARGAKKRSLEAMRILDLQHQGNGSQDEDVCIKSLLDTGGSLKELVFVKPLHLRIRLDCRDHPHTISQNETILSDTALEVNVSLD